MLEAAWFVEGDIHIVGRRYASICGNEEWSEAQWDLATEILVGEGCPAEWDGDYWVMSQDYELHTTLEWSDDESDEANIRRACEAAFKVIDEDSGPFEERVARLHKLLGDIAGE